MATPVNSTELLTLAAATARAAGAALAKRSDRTVNSESDHDIKLQADVDSENLIRERLARTKLPIIGEEIGGDAGLLSRDEPYWAVDPLDGTYNYLRGMPGACVSIGLWQGRRPLLGVVFDFWRDELYSGGAGLGLTLNGRALQTRWAPDVPHAVLCTGFPSGADRGGVAVRQFISQVERFKKIRMIGSAALALAYVASGRADAYFEESIKLWDIAAGLALVEGAGGFVRLDPGAGHPLSLNVWAAGRADLAG
ncbi:MAG TPA: inositol monophosphatase family protein [Opitutales bacterium]|nr:inositol monophosphatase family protein [Opitutales bacterium]